MARMGVSWPIGSKRPHRVLSDDKIHQTLRHDFKIIQLLSFESH